MVCIIIIIIIMHSLHNEILDFVSFLLPTQAEYNARLDLAERLDAIMKSLYDNAEIEVFGSVTSGLALPSRYG